MVKRGIPEVQKAFKIVKEEKDATKHKTISHYALYTDSKLMMECIHCNKRFAKNTTRQFNHLCECQKYLNYCQSKSIQNNVTRKVNVCSKPINQLPIRKLTAREKEDLDNRAARVCLIGGYPFTLFESEDMKYFCNGMNASYKPPIRQ